MSLAARPTAGLCAPRRAVRSAPRPPQPGRPARPCGRHAIVSGASRRDLGAYPDSDGNDPSSASPPPYPFDPREFVRVVPAVVGKGGRRHPAAAQGFIIFAEAPADGSDELALDEAGAAPRALSMDIGGDALLALLLGAARSGADDDDDDDGEGGEDAASHAAPAASVDVPPLALDLLWAVLQRGASLSKRAWHLQRVAVVDEAGGAYVARLFFGRPSERDDAPSSWEVRARPSDACWLALQADAPLFIRRDLFDARCAPLDALLRAADAGGGGGDDDDSDDEFYGEGGGEDAAAAAAAPHVEPPPPSVAPIVALRPDDPDGIVLLKRQLSVAVREQDFERAAELRDTAAWAAYARFLAADAAGDAAAIAAAREEVDAVLEGRAGRARARRGRAAAKGGGGGGVKPPTKPRRARRKPPQPDS